LKFIEVCVVLRIGTLLTTRVTGKVCGELPAPVAVTVTFSTYVFGARPASTVGFTEIAIACGVVPVPGVTVRKLAPPVTGVAVTVMGKPAVELVI
jgi:hypothetical protein